MLYPVQNAFRNILDLSGLWKFKIDPQNLGEKEKWFNGFNSNMDIALPGSWNEQLEEAGLLHYVGSAWYYRKIILPTEYNRKRILIRIGSADYNSKIWINGKFVGENKLGFLPFEFDITRFCKLGEQCDIVILVNNELTSSTIPQGIRSSQYLDENRLREETNPPARFDFSPFGGIHRPVQIITTPLEYIKLIKIDTKITGLRKGEIQAEIEIFGSASSEIIIFIDNVKNILRSSKSIQNKKAKIKLEINNCKFWTPEHPFLYELKVQLKKDSQIVDEYSLPIGIREIKIEGNKLLLNNKIIYLKGFGKHEDFSTIGKGLLLPLVVKDFGLIKWINANSFRTSHYPYSEEIMFYADKKGILVIDEVPAVSLDIRFANDETLKNHKEYITRLIDRDYNHPSVIMWAVGNEPNLVGAEEYFNGSGKRYWKEIFLHTRKLDKLRPITVPNCTRAGINDPVLEFCDVISLNRYYGWYEFPGNLELASKILSDEMDKIFKKYKKPILLTEFGADTLSGEHSTSIQMFTEEYQSMLLEKYIDVIRSKSYTIGEQLWNFADFRTPQHFRRVVLNQKGIFTRDRKPKLAAFKLKEIWAKK